MVDEYHELQGFVLQNITRTGVHLGTGSYGEVEELCWNGTKCAGKCLHETLLDQRQGGGASSIMASKFVSECSMIAKIRHPNVVCHGKIASLPVTLAVFHLGDCRLRS